MAGRWAQLAIDAHIAKAIDYSKPISKHIEAAIFDRLEMDRRLSLAALYPAKDADGLIERPHTWLEAFRDAYLLPWEAQFRLQQQVSEEDHLRSRINYLNQVQQQLKQH